MHILGMKFYSMTFFLIAEVPDMGTSISINDPNDTNSVKSFAADISPLHKSRWCDGGGDDLFIHFSRYPR